MGTPLFLPMVQIDVKVCMPERDETGRFPIGRVHRLSEIAAGNFTVFDRWEPRIMKGDPSAIHIGDENDMTCVSGFLFQNQRIDGNEHYVAFPKIMFNFRKCGRSSNVFDSFFLYESFSRFFFLLEIGMFLLRFEYLARPYHFQILLSEFDELAVIEVLDIYYLEFFFREKQKRGRVPCPLIPLVQRELVKRRITVAFFRKNMAKQHFQASLKTMAIISEILVERNIRHGFRVSAALPLV